MDFDLSKPQKLLKQSAREFLARECKPERVREIMSTETADDRALWSAAADQGWTALIIPEMYGGLGLGIVELAAVAEEMGRACMPGPLFSTMFASAALVRAGTEEQKRRWLEPIAAGEMRATVALGTEFVMDAGVADLILRFTRDGVEEVEKRALTIKRMASMDETRKVYSIDPIAFDIPSPGSALRSEPPSPASGRGQSSRPLPLAGEGRREASGEGMSHSLRAPIDIATVALCAEMVGGMQWILDTTVEYAKTRQQFGRAIGSFQAVQHQCADMLLLTESSRSATYYAAWALTHDESAGALAVSMAKAYCSDAFREVGNRGVQVHGGIGFTWEHDLQLYYKRAKASEVMFGDATFHRERIAALIVDRNDSVAEDSAEVMVHGSSAT